MIHNLQNIIYQELIKHDVKRILVILLIHTVSQGLRVPKGSSS